MTRSLERSAQTGSPDPIADIAAILTAGPTSVEVPKLFRHVDPRRVKPFDPGRMAIPYAEPEWADFKPGASGKFGSSLPAYKKAHQTSVLKYRLALTDWRKRERERIAELNAAKVKYDEQMRARIEAHDLRADRLTAALRAGDPATVLRFVTMSLEASTFPEWLAVERSYTYRPSARELTVRVEVPPRELLPEGDDDERAEWFESLVVRLTLRCMRDAFLGSPDKVVDRVRVFAMADEVCLSYVRSERSVFTGVDLDHDPVFSLFQLGGELSPEPYALKPIGGAT